MVEKVNDVQKPKTSKQLEKEAKNAEKLAKFAEKQAKKLTENIKSEKETLTKEKKKKEEKKVITYDKNCPAGEKKDVICDLPSQYSPKYVEAAWYEWWKKQGYFKPEYWETIGKTVDEPPFVIVIPPPNITGLLHLGHALTNSIEDAICRWHRMKGKRVLWVPGCDHAGIATQVVVEKKIQREKGLSRHDLGREKFVDEIWKWKNQKGHSIYYQLEKLGSSLDWDRTRFTMDPMLQHAVTESFIKLHADGIIYRSSRLVNWSCTLKSAISDIEVEKKELTGRTHLRVPGYSKTVEFGVLVSFAYQVDGCDEKLIVATTRVETMLGDTAVAVHPDDPRYKHLHGKTIKHPFVDRLLPIITDEFVDLNFGTGAVKITPAHDANDYVVGKTHGLPFVSIFTDDGLVCEGYGEFSNMKRFEAREAVLEALKRKNLYVETKDNPMVVPMCSRSKDVIEPMLKPQWYIKSDEMAKNAINVVKSGELELIPKIHEKTWYHWMNEIRDWCISRQLWWGHRIPAYFVTIEGTPTPQTEAEISKHWICERSEDAALEKASKIFNVSKDKIFLEQDPDVLDTWYSSGLFPFSVMGWPDKTKDLELYYPNALLETGHDILFFWVARMVFMAEKLTGVLPFRQVYLHAMVRDAHGRKMSKSLGNVIDPTDVINGISLEELHKQLELNSNLDPSEMKKAKEGQKRDYPNGIPECGTDALRFGLCAYTAQGRDINLDVLRLNGYRNFCNKLWNATKFSLNYFKAPFKPWSLQLLREKIRESSSNSVSPKIFESLNKHLESNSYISGHCPSLRDYQIFSTITREQILTHPHALRWWTHMSSFSLQECKLLEKSSCKILLPELDILIKGNKSKSSASISDRWMLSQLSLAVRECNAGFEQFNFPRATTALYNLWWYQICDVYLECIKPVMIGKDVESKEITQNVLFCTIRCGLLLIAPFMPFLSEELFQRLPHTDEHAPSVCVAPYPLPQNYDELTDTESEEKFKIGQKVITEVRSAKAKYDVPNKTKIQLSLQVHSDEAKEALEQLTSEIASLCFAEAVNVSDEALPGSVPAPVGKDVVAWMKLQGLVDLSKCEERLEKKRNEIENRLENLNKEMNKPNYDKTPEEIRSKNDERKTEMDEEFKKTLDALQQIKIIK